MDLCIFMRPSCTASTTTSFHEMPHIRSRLIMFAAIALRVKSSSLPPSLYMVMTMHSLMVRPIELGRSGARLSMGRAAVTGV